MRENRSLILHCKIKLEWGKEDHTVRCARNERNGLAWFETGIWKLREMGRGSEKGRCPQCWKEEDVIHILLKCSETKSWRENILSSKWVDINAYVAYTRTIIYTNVGDLRKRRKIPVTIRC
jgi:hypothetical protein